MRIQFLSDNFPPEVNAPASRTFEHCREWARQGHQVTVITCVPNFPRGKVFEGYRNRLWQRETVEGIEVIRVWTYITANEGFLRRTIDYLSFMVSGALAGMFARRPDVVLGTSPQFFTACAAWFVAVCRRCPFIFELRDLWPESIRAVGAVRNPAVLRLFERLELFLYRRARGIVSVTHSFREVLERRGIDPAKIAVVTNGVDLSRFKPGPKDSRLLQSLGLEGKFVLGYIGTHGMAHGLDTLLDAAAKLRRCPDGDRFRLLLLGDGAEKHGLKVRAAEMGLDNVLFLDTVPKDQVASYWSLLDVAIIHLRKTELFNTVIPSKLFECMGMGIPVLHGVPGESARIVLEEGCGAVFESGDADELVRLVMTCASDGERLAKWRQAGRDAAGRYERAALARRMLGQLIEWAPRT